jgi:hypothetical protein
VVSQLEVWELAYTLNYLDESWTFDRIWEH